MIVLNPATGLKGSVVRGPYNEYGEQWYDVVFPNDLGEPGQYSHRYRVQQLIVIEEDQKIFTAGVVLGAQPLLSYVYKTETEGDSNE